MEKLPSIILFFILVYPICADPLGDYVAARGTLRCFNRPFQGRVWLMNDGKGPILPAGFDTMDSVFVNAEGSFELLGEKPLKTWRIPFLPCIYIPNNCTPPIESAEPDSKNETQLKMEMEWERGYYEEEEMNLGWTIDFWAKGEAMEAKRNSSAFKDWNDKIKPEKVKPELGIDNQEDVTKNGFCIYIPNYYYSKQEVPPRFFELGVLNLGGKIHRKKEIKMNIN